jgi:hypothetical protein
MQKKICVWLSFLFAYYTPQALACDACGCTISTQSLGLLPQFSTHFIGLQYLYAQSSSNHPSMISSQSNDQTTQQLSNVQIWGRYQVSKKNQLFVFAPYIHSVNQSSSNVNALSGIGDVTLMVNRSFPVLKRKPNQHLLLLGIGLKMPIGKYNPTAMNNELPNTQLGTGSWDGLLSMNYTHRASRFGYNVDMTYVLTSANAYQYKYGDRFNTALLGFSWFEHKQWKFVPQIGARVEYALHDYDNYAKKWLNKSTGGVMNFATVGSQIYYKKVGCKLMLHLPLYQQYAAGAVQSYARFESGIFILF